MKIAIVVGTRPEIIKMAPLVKECEKRSLDYFLVHSNQHYSKEMDQVFFENFELAPAKYNLGIGSGRQGNQTGKILIKMEEVFEKENPDLVFVQGDTNTTAAAALAASKMDIQVAHIEAGLRSYDKSMPEENNRVITDHISDYLFAVTQRQAENLKTEGIASDKVHVVGNTVADTLFSHLAKSKDNTEQLLEQLHLTSKNYALLTTHRAGNVDHKDLLAKVLQVLGEVADYYGKTMVWPMHPRTEKKIKEYNLTIPSAIQTLTPLDYNDFIALQKNAEVVLTDSGGLQEEACILGVPCITLRENTERPESIDVGANILTGFDATKIKQAFDYYLGQKRSWENPFGNGTTAPQILDIVCKDLERTSVCTIGLGYMGLPFSCLLAKAGHTVRGFDVDTKKVEQINRGESPFEEAGMSSLLQEALNSGTFLADDKVTQSEVYIISVPTPKKGEACDMTYVRKAVQSLKGIVKNNDLVVLESTVPPGTCEKEIVSVVAEWGVHVDVAFCPERAIPGNTLSELQNNDRVVGGSTPQATDRAYNLYKTFCKGQLFKTNLRTAETVKLMENTFRDVNIALANEFSQIAEEINVNVWEAIELANKHPRVNILQPGPGVGGHCIAIDPWFLVQDVSSAKLIPMARQINDQRPKVIVDYLNTNFKFAKKVGLLGVAYKKDVDDARETPAEAIAAMLTSSGKEVCYFDPFVLEWKHSERKSFNELEEWADVFLLVTDHTEFKSITTEVPVVDTKNCIRTLTI